MPEPVEHGQAHLVEPDVLAEVQAELAPARSEANALVIARKLGQWRKLRERIAHPERSSLPWSPAVPLDPCSRCLACGKTVVASTRATHAVEREILAQTGATGAAKCVAWALGLDLGARP